VHLLGAPIRVFKGLEETQLESFSTDRCHVVLGKSVLTQEEHSAPSLEQEDLDHRDKARLPSTQGLLTISGTMGTMYRGLRRKE
jgi:hypothetical protein